MKALHYTAIDIRLAELATILLVFCGAESELKCLSKNHAAICMIWSMKLSTDLRRGRTCVFLMHVHLVFVTKCRRNVFTKPILAELRTIFQNVCQDFSAQLVEFEGEKDYVYLLVNYPPKISVPKLVNSLKGVSSRLVRKNKHPTVQQALWGEGLWSPSYFAGACSGPPLEIIRQYIEQQDFPKI